MVTKTEEAKTMVDPLPYKVDFANNEVCMGGVWTNPKYRRMGLLEYTDFIEHQFLKPRGIVTTRASIAASNIACQRAVEKFGAKMYAEARFLKILRWKFWKEKPLTQDSGCGQYDKLTPHIHS